MTDAVPPVLIFVLGALALPLIPGRLKSAWLLFIPVIGFINLLYLGEGIHFKFDFLEYQLVLGRVDKLSLIFAYIFHLISFIAILYALHVKDNLQQMAGLMYAGSALGAVFAGDLFTFFVFWEMLTVTSIFLIWSRSNKSGPGCGLPVPAGACGRGAVPSGGYCDPCKPDRLHWV